MCRRTRHIVIPVFLLAHFCCPCRGRCRCAQPLLLIDGRSLCIALLRRVSQLVVLLLVVLRLTLCLCIALHRRVSQVVGALLLVVAATAATTATLATTGVRHLLLVTLVGDLLLHGRVRHLPLTGARVPRRAAVGIPLYICWPIWPRGWPLEVVLARLAAWLATGGSTLLLVLPLVLLLSLHNSCASPCTVPGTTRLGCDRLIALP